MLSLKKRKTPIQKRRWNMRKYSFTLFPCFAFRLLWHDGLYFWILFQFSGLILYFFLVRFLLGMLISVWTFVFLFSGSVFLFWVSVLAYVFLFWVCFFLFLLLFLLSCGFFVSISHPIYLIVLRIWIQPLENTSKLRWKFLHRDQIVQVRNNLL